jgi:hypothetical protein
MEQHRSEPASVREGMDDGGGVAEGRHGAQGGPPLRGECGPRLDKRTYLDREKARCRIVAHDHGGGLCEIGWSFIPVIVMGKVGRGDSEQRLEHEDRAVRRGRSRLRQLVLSANADHLLTNTYRANVTEFRQASADLSRFIREVKTHLPGWVYIAVPERQQRGAWHWHIAVVGRQDVDLLRSCWLGVIGDGNIDVQKPRNRTANRRLAIVKYLGKYLAKGFEDGDRELNGHRFRASLGIKVPSQSIQLPPEHRNNVPGYVLDELRARAGSVGYTWVDPQGFAGWACSW